MRRVVAILVVCTLLVSPLGTAPNSLQGMDFSAARVSRGLWDTFIISPVLLEGAQYDLVIRPVKADSGQWEIVSFEPLAASSIPGPMILDFAAASSRDGQTIEISNIIFNGSVYKGTFSLDPAASPIPNGGLSASELAIPEQRKTELALLQSAFATPQPAASPTPVIDAAVATPSAATTTPAAVAATPDQSATPPAVALSTPAASSVPVSSTPASSPTSTSPAASPAPEQTPAAAASPAGTPAASPVVAAAQTPSASPAVASATPASSVSPGAVTVWLEPAPTRQPPAVSASPSRSASPARTTTPTRTPAGTARPSATTGRTALEDSVESLRQQVGEVSRKLDILAGRFDQVSAQFTKQAASGFNGAQRHSGRWVVTPALAEQNDAGQFFAKLSLPVAQNKTPMLYRFEAKTSGRGWVGLGLHIFAGNSRLDNGYGFGKSLLVWLTRDRETYQNDGTYLQLYRSDDDIDMERVLDASVAESLDSWMKIEIIFDPIQQYISIAINGQEKLRYKTNGMVQTGASIAFRTLGGGATFRNFSAFTAE